MTLTQVDAVSKTVETWLDDILNTRGHPSVAGYLPATTDTDPAPAGSAQRPECGACYVPAVDREWSVPNVGRHRIHYSPIPARALSRHRSTART